MEALIGGRQHFALVNEVNAQRFEYLGLGEMPDAALGHHRDRHRLHYLLDDLEIRHARHAALGANIGGHALQRHHRDRTGILGDLGLLGVGHVHNHAAAQHLG